MVENGGSGSSGSMAPLSTTAKGVMLDGSGGVSGTG